MRANGGPDDARNTTTKTINIDQPIADTMLPVESILGAHNNSLICSVFATLVFCQIQKKNCSTAECVVPTLLGRKIFGCTHKKCVLQCGTCEQQDDNISRTVQQRKSIVPKYEASDLCIFAMRRIEL